MKTFVPLSIGASLVIIAGTAQSQPVDDVFFSNVIVRASLICVGAECVDEEPEIPDRTGLKIKSTNPAILFDDQVQAIGSPTRDWQLNAGDNAFPPRDAFYLQDLTAGTEPFTIEGAAPENAFFVSEGGDIGLGTALPQANLHVVNAFSGASLRIESASTTSGPPSIWEASTGNFGYVLGDRQNVTFPFKLENGTPTDTIVMTSDGNIGLGTDTPEAPLELSAETSFNFFRITATGAAVNDSVDITFTGGPLGTGQLRYNIVDGDNQEMSLDANGNMILDGTLTTAGPTCAGGCDRVFDADYPLPSITAHAEAMFEAGYLPSVGPTLPGQPVNVTEKMANMLNALEHAHIYIDQLHTENRAQAEQISALTARLDVLEAQ